LKPRNRIGFCPCTAAAPAGDEEEEEDEEDSGKVLLLLRSEWGEDDEDGDDDGSAAIISTARPLSSAHLIIVICNEIMTFANDIVAIFCAYLHISWDFI
jgi:hypothetical protein